MPIIPFSRVMGEYWESKCIAFVNEGKGRRGRDELVKCIHDGSKGGSPAYARVYLLNVKRTNPLEPDKTQVRFFYHTKVIDDREGKKEVEKCEIRIAEEGIRLLGETFEIGGYLKKLDMYFMDADGNIDTVKLIDVLKTAVKLVEGIDDPEVKIILDK
jgi:hypothetical protein